MNAKTKLNPLFSSRKARLLTLVCKHKGDDEIESVDYLSALADFAKVIRQGYVLKIDDMVLHPCVDRKLLHARCLDKGINLRITDNKQHDPQLEALYQDESVEEQIAQAESELHNICKYENSEAKLFHKAVEKLVQAFCKKTEKTYMPQEPFVLSKSRRKAMRVKFLQAGKAINEDGIPKKILPISSGKNNANQCNSSPRHMPRGAKKPSKGNQHSTRA